MRFGPPGKNKGGFTPLSVRNQGHSLTVPCSLRQLGGLPDCTRPRRATRPWNKLQQTPCAVSDVCQPLRALLSWFVSLFLCWAKPCDYVATPTSNCAGCGASTVPIPCKRAFDQQALRSCSSVHWHAAATGSSCCGEFRNRGSECFGPSRALLQIDMPPKKQRRCWRKLLLGNPRFGVILIWLICRAVCCSGCPFVEGTLLRVV